MKSKMVKITATLAAMLFLALDVRGAYNSPPAAVVRYTQPESASKLRRRHPQVSADSRSVTSLSSLMTGGQHCTLVGRANISASVNKPGLESREDREKTRQD